MKIIVCKKITPARSDCSQGAGARYHLSSCRACSATHFRQAQLVARNGRWPLILNGGCRSGSPLRGDVRPVSAAALALSAARCGRGGGLLFLVNAFGG